MNYPTYQPGIGAPTLTFTPTLSAIASLTPTLTGTATLMAGTPTRSAALGAMSDTARSVSLSQALASKLGTEWPLGCGGIILMLLGAWRVWALSRKAAHRGGGRGYYRMR